MSAITPAPEPVSILPVSDEKTGNYGVDIAHVEDATRDFDPGVGGKDQWSRIKADADQGEAFEHSLSVWQSVKTYRSVRVFAPQLWGRD